MLQRRGLDGLKHIEIRSVAVQSWIRDTRLTTGRVETNTDIVTSEQVDQGCSHFTESLGLHLTRDIAAIHSQNSANRRNAYQCVDKQSGSDTESKATRMWKPSLVRESHSH